MEATGDGHLLCVPVASAKRLFGTTRVASTDGFSRRGESSPSFSGGGEARALDKN